MSHKILVIDHPGEDWVSEAFQRPSSPVVITVPWTLHLSGMCQVIIRNTPVNPHRKSIKNLRRYARCLSKTQK